MSISTKELNRFAQRTPEDIIKMWERRVKIKYATVYRDVKKVQYYACKSDTFMVTYEPVEIKVVKE
jgi:hypothetical protein